MCSFENLAILLAKVVFILQGPAMVADKLGYFIQTGQMVQLLQQASFKIGNVQLAKFSPLPGTPGPGPEPAAAKAAAPQGAVATAQAGKQKQLMLLASAL